MAITCCYGRAVAGGIKKYFWGDGDKNYKQTGSKQGITKFFLSTAALQTPSIVPFWLSLMGSQMSKQKYVCRVLAQHQEAAFRNVGLELKSNSQIPGMTVPGGRTDGVRKEDVLT